LTEYAQQIVESWSEGDQVRHFGRSLARAPPQALMDLTCIISIGGWPGSARLCRPRLGRPYEVRCIKALVEERLFAHRCDLFTRLDPVFMDTTNLCFEAPAVRR
jgi:hypothetical protein